MNHPNNTPEGWDANAAVYSINTITPYYSEVSIKVANIEGYLSSASATKTTTLLDVAGGPGVLALPLGEKIVALQKEGKLEGKEIQVIGSDFSPKMVEVLETKISSSPDLQRVIVPRVLNGMNLDLQDNSIDIGFSNFGIFLFPDSDKGLSELFRVLKSGGRGVIATWKAPLGSGMSIVMQRLFQLHKEDSEKLEEKNKLEEKKLEEKKLEEKKLEEKKEEGEGSPHNNNKNMKLPWGTEEELEEALKKAGFQDIVIETYSSDWKMDQKDFLDMMLTNPFFRETPGKLGGSEKFLDLYNRVMLEMFGKEPVSLPAVALIALAHKK